MARIRSIHPGFFTDENMVTVSPFARLLLIGLLTEADDGGTFEWKPVTLKMRLFPVDAVDIASLLAELSTIDAVRCIEIDGRKCGVVRNFCKYQRPKKPNLRFVIPSEFRTYVGLSDDSSPPMADEEPLVPQKEELTSQRERRMEDGGGEEEEKKEEEPSPPAPPASDLGKYAFEAGVIRLTQKDFDQWKRAYEHLSLEAELISLAEWAGTQPKWFHAVSGALSKRNREISLRKAQSATGPPDGGNAIWHSPKGASI